MSKHSKLQSPSASGIWMVCTAQPQALANADIERSSSAASEMGTWKHDLSEDMMLGLVTKDDKPADMEFMDWNEVLVAVNCAKEFLSDLEPGDDVAYEHEVGLKDWRADCFGTSDITGFKRSKGIVYIGDYKFGRVRVPASSSQLLIYGRAYIEYLKDKYGDQIVNEIKELRFAVIQPKVSHSADVHTMDMLDFMKWDEEQLIPAQKEVLEGRGRFVPGPHCTEKFCTLGMAGACPHALSQVDDLVEDMVDLEKGEQKFELNAHTLERMLPILKNRHLIEKTIAAGFALAHSMAMDGKEVPGFKLVKGKGKRSWVDEEKAKKYLTGKIPKAEMFKETFLTAPQAEAKLKASGKLEHTRSKNLFEEQIEWAEGRPILVPESDKREALHVNQQDELDEFADTITSTEEAESFDDLLDDGDDVLDVKDDEGLFDELF